MRLRQMLLGLLIGIALSLWRAAPVADLGIALGADPLTRLGGGWLRWLLVALLVWLARRLLARGLELAWVLPSLWLGFALHALLLPAVLPGASLGKLVLSALLALCAWQLGRRQRASAEFDAQPPEGPAAPAELCGLGLAACGAALAFLQLARPLSWLGLGARGDDSCFALVLLLGLWIGVLAFGRALAKAQWQSALTAAALPLSAALCLLGWTFLGELTPEGALDLHLRHFGMDLSLLGTWGTDALLAASTFVAPAFALGAALCGPRGAARWIALCAGAAAGAWLHAQGAPAARAFEFGSRGDLGLCLATSLAAVGASIALLTGARPFARPQLLGLGTAVLVGVGSWLAHKPAPLLLSPWLHTLPVPLLLVDGPAGLGSVEGNSKGESAAFLERVRLTPLGSEEAFDLACLEAALEASGQPASEQEFLLLGQLTPTRERWAREQGFALLRRGAPWGALALDFERALFDAAVPQAALWGPPMDAAQVRAWIADGPTSGSAQLLIAPALQGPPSVALLSDGGPPVAVRVPESLSLELPPHASAVLWYDCAAPLSASVLPARALLLVQALERASLGLCLGGAGRDPATSVATGRARWSGLETELTLLRRPASLRTARASEQLCARLSAASDASHSDLLEGLRLHFAAQTHSSPWETRAQAVELDLAALELWRADALSNPPDALRRSLFEALAQVLADKRMPDRVLELVEPVSVAWRQRGAAVPPSILRALAQAYREFDDPQAALTLLAQLLELSPYDLELYSQMAELEGQLLHHEREAQLLERALALQPGRRDFERRLAIARVRLGDARGVRAIQDLLLEDPDDEALLPFLQPGPYAPPERGYQPPSPDFEHAEEH